MADISLRSRNRRGKAREERYEEGIESRLHAAALLVLQGALLSVRRWRLHCKGAPFEHLLPQFRSIPLLRPVMRILCSSDPPSLFACFDLFIHLLRPLLQPYFAICQTTRRRGRRRRARHGRSRVCSVRTYVSLSPPSMRSCAARNAASILQTYFI